MRNEVAPGLTIETVGISASLLAPERPSAYEGQRNPWRVPWLHRAVVAATWAAYAERRVPGTRELNMSP
jgi:hypothetical protein